MIEILISIAIVVFIVVMLGQILSVTQGIWRRSEARTDPFRDARAALDLMSRELAFAVTHDKAPVLALENLYTQASDSTDGPQHNQQGYALLPMSNTNKTDLCTVGFYCTWDSTKHAYVLRRHFLSSDATFNRLQTAGLPSTPNPVATSAVYAPSSPAKNPAQDEDIAAYVWDLKIVPYEYKTGVLAPNGTYPISYRATLPQFIEISFKAMSPQAANALTSQGIATKTWFDTAGLIYKNQILPQTHQFTTRIRLQNAIKP